VDVFWADLERWWVVSVVLFFVCALMALAPLVSSMKKRFEKEAMENE
jgi:hypothetical protein